MSKMRTEVLLCKCYSPMHMIMFHLYEEDKEVYASIHLCPQPWWKRIKNAILYILGKDIPYGMFDEIILKEEDADKLQRVVNALHGNMVQPITLSNGLKMPPRVYLANKNQAKKFEVKTTRLTDDSLDTDEDDID